MPKKDKDLPSWRTIARKRMKAAAEKEAREKSPLKDPDFMYRWEHVRAVVTCAVKLAKLTGADVEVVEAAAWLHDIRKDTGDNHPKEGARYARQLLLETDFPTEKIPAVAYTIENHMGLWRDEPLTDLNAQVLWDADKLTKIGLTAAVHWLCGDVTRNRIDDTEEIIKRFQRTSWRAKTVTSMHTEPARRAAQSRFEAFDRLVVGLSAELAAADLT